MRAKEFTKQGLTEEFEEAAQEYKSYLFKTLPQLMRFLKGVRGAPSEKQMLAAIDVAYDVMKRTGDIKQAAKANKDALNRMIDQQSVAEDTQHISQDLEDVAHWMRTTPDKLNIVVKQEPIEKFIKQIREMHGTYDEFPEDEERTNRILKLLKRGAEPLPMYVEEGDPDLFVMEGRHRMVAFWLAGMKTIPVAYVSVKDQQGVAEGDARPENFTKNGLTWTLEHLGSIDGKDLGAGGLVDVFKGYQDINNKEKFRWFIRGQRTGVLRPVSSEHTAIRKFLHPNVANNDEYKKFTEQGVTEDTLNEFSAFHGTFRPSISRFKPLSHFGTERAATERLNAVKSTTPSLSNADTGYIYQLDLGITAPGVVKDYYDIVDPGPSSMKKIAAWSKDLLKDTRFAAYTGKNPINGKPNDDGKHILQHFAKMADSGYWAEYFPYTKFISIWINFLQDAGVDGLVYSNQVEHPRSKSYITFNPGQIKIIGKPKLVNLQSSEEHAAAEKHSKVHFKQSVAEGKQQVERNGIQLNVSIDGATVDIRPMINGNQVGYVVFDRDGETLVADDLAIDEEYRRRGIAKIIYDYLKELGFTVKRSTDQLPAGKAFWDKYKGAQGQVWEDEHVDEMALASYKTMGDFTKQGPFTGADKKLVPHHKNIEKATQFFEQTPYDFRLFFSNIPGTGKYSEHGPMTPDELRKVFGKDAEEIINGSSDAITVVYVGNKGDRKVMLTPWMMAHRFGHAVNRGAYKAGYAGAWKEAEKHFFTTINNLLNEYYGKVDRFPDSGYGRPKSERMNFNLTPEYNALFNAIGTQRSSRSGEIRRPYEFFYELFAQYLGTGKITLNPFPTNLTYGRKAWGNPTRFMNIKPEYRDEAERRYAAEVLGRDMEILFDDVLSSSVGQIYVM